MKKIRIGFSTTHYLLSVLIRKIQNTSSSHVYLEFKDENVNENLIYEAKGLDVHLINKEKMAGEIVSEFEVEVEDSIYSNVLYDIYNDIGTPYGWSELFGFALVWFVSWFGIIMRNPLDSSGKVCSEVVGDICIKYLGIKKDVSKNDIDVKWLYNKISNHSNFKRIK